MRHKHKQCEIIQKMNSQGDYLKRRKILLFWYEQWINCKT